jgi:hypothetical protein
MYKWKYEIKILHVIEFAKRKCKIKSLYVIKFDTLLSPLLRSPGIRLGRGTSIISLESASKN